LGREVAAKDEVLIDAIKIDLTAAGPDAAAGTKWRLGVQDDLC
jgi:hypothetical protein